MAPKTKKNKAKTLSKNEPIIHSQRPQVPQEVLQLLQIHYRTKRKARNPLHYLCNTTGTTKTWIPAASRCRQPPWPQLRSLHDPAEDEYSTDTSHFTKHEEVAMVGHRFIRANGFIERGQDIYECVVADPFDVKNKYMEFTSVAYLEDKMYALSMQGSLAVIDSRCKIVTGFGSNRAVPSVTSRFFKEYLVEMNGGVYLIFFIHERSLEVVDQVEVFRLCLDKVKWVKVERLQGKTLFFDVQCVWVESAEIGCREDCVYFTWGEGSDNRWWVYDMKTGCFSHV